MSHLLMYLFICHFGFPSKLPGLQLLPLAVCLSVSHVRSTGYAGHPWCKQKHCELCRVFHEEVKLTTEWVLMLWMTVRRYQFGENTNFNLNLTLPNNMWTHIPRLAFILKLLTAACCVITADLTHLPECSCVFIFPSQSVATDVNSTMSSWNQV